MVYGVAVGGLLGQGWAGKEDGLDQSFENIKGLVGIDGHHVKSVGRIVS